MKFFLGGVFVFSNGGFRAGCKWGIRFSCAARGGIIRIIFSLFPRGCDQITVVALFAGHKRGVKFSMSCERGDPANHYCKSSIFGRYKIWRICYFLSDNRGLFLNNPI